MDEAEKRLYRRTLSAFPTGVALVVAPDGEDAVALTINSFTSLSLDPPLVMWSLGRASDRGVWFREAETFTVNILGAEDAELAQDCARRGQYRLPLDRLDRSRPGQPAVTGALTRLYCRRAGGFPFADHLVLVGEVMDYEGREGDALTYFRSRFGRAVSPEEEA